MLVHSLYEKVANTISQANLSKLSRSQTDWLYALIFLILTVNFALADDENFIRKAAKHYNLSPLSDYLQDASSNTHAFIEVTKRCSALLGSSAWALSHLNGLSDDDPQILDLDTMYEDLRQFSFRVHVQAIRGVELNQDTYTESMIEVDPDIHDYQTQYFGRLHRNHDKDATLIENDPLLQDETFACIGTHEQLREGGYF